eukprot:scaffold2053_cov71-Phaeocystis_antarctica.AAC.1
MRFSSNRPRPCQGGYPHVLNNISKPSLKHKHKRCGTVCGVPGYSAGGVVDLHTIRRSRARGQLSTSKQGQTSISSP